MEGRDYPDLPVNIVTQNVTTYTIVYVVILFLLNCLGPLLNRFKLFTGVSN